MMRKADSRSRGGALRLGKVMTVIADRVMGEVGVAVVAVVSGHAVLCKP